MTQGSPVDEFLLGGLSTSLACVLSNSFETVKTRMQLQGELQAKGTYTRHYRNVFQAFTTIVEVEGWSGLQRGLGPAMLYAFVMNGVRLGTYQSLVNNGFTRDATGKSDFGRTVLAGAAGGCFGGMVASPLYMVKTHLQSQALREIAVGHQYPHRGPVDALLKIYRERGFRGLWRGVEGAVPRLMLGSALQLSTFSWIKDRIRQTGKVSETWVSVLASLLSTVNIVVFMEPFDVVRTRLYNQPLDAKGRGLFYSGLIDCFVKIARTEGPTGFYKGAFAAFFRSCPQVVLGLSFWDKFRDFYLAWRTKKESK